MFPWMLKISRQEEGEKEDDTLPALLMQESQTGKLVQLVGDCCFCWVPEPWQCASELLLLLHCP